MNFFRRSQSAIELTLIMTLVAAGVILMRPYIIRGVNAHMKTLEESVQDSMSDPLIQANILLSPICGDTICDATENDPTNPATYCCVDCGSVVRPPDGCGDGRCCSETGEDIESGGTTACPRDCGRCNDGVCCNETNPLTAARCRETATDCCADCPPPGATCQGVPNSPCCRCNSNNYPNRCVESTDAATYPILARNECAIDCQTAQCGNGICESGETVANCGDCFSCNPGGDPLFYDDVCHDVAKGGSPYRELLGSGGTPGNCICDCHCGDGICMDGTLGHEVPPECVGRTGWPESTSNCAADCQCDWSFIQRNRGNAFACTDLVWPLCCSSPPCGTLPPCPDGGVPQFNLLCSYIGCTPAIMPGSIPWPICVGQVPAHLFRCTEINTWELGVAAIAYGACDYSRDCARVRCNQYTPTECMSHPECYLIEGEYVAKYTWVNTISPCIRAGQPQLQDRYCASELPSLNTGNGGVRSFCCPAQPGQARRCYTFADSWLSSETEVNGRCYRCRRSPCDPPIAGCP